MAMIAARRVDLTPLLTHRFSLDDIAEAYDIFSHQRDRVFKVLLHPTVSATDHLPTSGTETTDTAAGA
jgi:hypothetical protein